MKITTDALVIREKVAKDSDRIITLFSKEYGLINAYATGVKSIKSKRGSATGLLSYSNFTLQKKGDFYHIAEASVNRVFFGAGDDIIRLTIAQYFCEICYLFASESKNDEFLRLILNSLYFLSDTSKSPFLIKAITELRTCCISGFMPSLIGCDYCGEFENGDMYFSLSNGKLFCNEHSKKEGVIFLPSDILKAMRHIVFSEFKNIYSFELSEENSVELSNITESYIENQTDHKFKTLEFLKSLT